VCTATGQLERVGGKWYDRKASVTCESWAFAEGAIFTVVQLNGPTAATGGRAFAGMGGGKDNVYDFGQHDNWALFYSADDGESHYTEGYGSQMLDVVSNWGTDRFLILRPMLNNMSTPQRPMGPIERTLLAIGLMLLWFMEPSRSSNLTLLILAITPITAAWAVRRAFAGDVQTKSCRSCCAACCSMCCISFIVFLLEVYVIPLCFYALLPRDYWSNPRDEAIFRARPLSNYEKSNSATNQLTVSLLVLALGAMVGVAFGWRKRSVKDGFAYGPALF
jgi:hypothetical protein